MEKFSDNHLLQQIKNDNHSAFDILFERYWKKLYQCALARVSDKETAQDIVQELLIKLWDRRRALDGRCLCSIGIAEGTYDASFVMAISAVKSPVGYVPTAGKSYTPFIKKYIHPPFVATVNSNDDWPIYRYSEALLLLAEAQNEQGKLPLVALNKVRNRAGLPSSAETDQAKLRDIIMHERRVELAFENKRFHDLQRMPNGLAIMQAYATKAKTTFTNLVANAFDIQAYKFLYPLPLPEINLNPGMKQNPGYAF